ncbi:MAG: hypothetical protein ACLFTK_03590 [Anaerolineales bacterium]
MFHRLLAMLRPAPEDPPPEHVIHIPQQTPTPGWSSTASAWPSGAWVHENFEPHQATTQIPAELLRILDYSA